ncbi:unnamed protein product [Symbiodinium natans]|uniref:Inositol polyphosphate-related phosphatase domain-containing protein n=1 Tax=Symbiodinium natans TaxID=878477 RepID=A0A812PBV2_9DINO|nr:unnamed protein product [Symbiodinium natans]
MSRFFAGILLLFCWTATAIRTDSDEIDSDGANMKIWVYTLNLGKLGQQEDSIAGMVDSILLVAGLQSVKLVSVNFQEAPSDKDFLIRPPVAGWRVIRTRHLCSEGLHALKIRCDFALFSFLYIRDYRRLREAPVDGDIRGVRTLHFTKAHLRDLRATDAVDDKYAEACGGADESNELPENYWGGVLNTDGPGGHGADMDVLKAAQRCHAVAVEHEDTFGVSAKASLITRYRLTFVAEGRNRVADFVVSTSHFGKIPDSKEMFKLSSRSQELGEAMDALGVVNDNHTVPTFMTGDWNFRMVPFDDLKKLANFSGLQYTGPVLSMVAGKMRYGWVNQSPMRDGVAYEETHVAAVALDPLNAPKLRLLQEVEGFDQLYKHFATASKRMPTCRFKEGKNRPSAFRDVPVMVFDGDANTTTFRPSEDFLSTEDGKWSTFKREGYDLVKEDKSKFQSFSRSKPAKELVTRLPSQCDQIFWSNGIQMLSMGPAMDVLGLAFDAMLESDHNMLELRAELSL